MLFSYSAYFTGHATLSACSLSFAKIRGFGVECYDRFFSGWQNWLKINWSMLNLNTWNNVSLCLSLRILALLNNIGSLLVYFVMCVTKMNCQDQILFWALVFKWPKHFWIAIRLWKKNFILIDPSLRELRKRQQMWDRSSDAIDIGQWEGLVTN